MLLGEIVLFGAVGFDVVEFPAARMLRDNLPLALAQPALVPALAALRALFPPLGDRALLLASGATILTTNLFQTTFFHSHAESAYFWLLFGLVAHAEVDVRVAATQRRAAASPFTRLQAAPASLAVGFPRS